MNTCISVDYPALAAAIVAVIGAMASAFVSVYAALKAHNAATIMSGQSKNAP